MHLQGLVNLLLLYILKASTNGIKTLIYTLIISSILIPTPTLAFIFTTNLVAKYFKQELQRLLKIYIKAENQPERLRKRPLKFKLRFY